MSSFSLPLCLLALLASLSVGFACFPQSWTVNKVADGAAGMLVDAFDTPEVEESLAGQRMWTGQLARAKTTTFSCVDSRGTWSPYPVLQTPGGDLAELMGGMVTYFRETGEEPTEEGVDMLLKAFIKQVATAQRPLYFHTAVDKVDKVLKMVGNVTGKHYTSFPNVAPEDPAELAAFMNALTYWDNQGCGHIKLMMHHPVDYGLMTPAEEMVANWTIRSYFNYWWPTEPSSYARKKISNPALRDSLEGKAVTIVTVAEGSCEAHKFPVGNPSHAGNEMFLYYASAVGKFRANVITPMMVSMAKSMGKKINADSYLASLESLQATQLNATLTMLAPANQIGIFTAEVMMA